MVILALICDRGYASPLPIFDRDRIRLIAADERKSLQPPAVTDIDEGQITILAVPHKRIRYVVFK